MMVRAMIARWLVVVSLALLATLSLAVVALAQPAHAAGTRAEVLLVQDDDDDGGDDDGGRDDDGDDDDGGGRGDDDGRDDDDDGVGEVPRGGVDTGAGGTAPTSAGTLPYALGGGAALAGLAGLGAALWRRARSEA
jgi:hypothetical protein